MHRDTLAALMVIGAVVVAMFAPLVMDAAHAASSRANSSPYASAIR